MKITLDNSMVTNNSFEYLVVTLYDMKKCKYFCNITLHHPELLMSRKYCELGCVLLHDGDTGHRPVGTSPGHAHGGGREEEGNKTCDYDII